MTMTTQAVPRAPGGTLGVAAPVNPRGMFWLALAVVSTLPLFWFGFTGLAQEWTRPEFSHGPVIPVLSFYMFLREMKFVPPAAPGRRPLAGRRADDLRASRWRSPATSRASTTWCSMR